MKMIDKVESAIMLEPTTGDLFECLDDLSIDKQLIVLKCILKPVDVLNSKEFASWALKNANMLMLVKGYRKLDKKAKARKEGNQ